MKGLKPGFQPRSRRGTEAEGCDFAKSPASSRRRLRPNGILVFSLRASFICLLLALTTGCATRRTGEFIGTAPAFPPEAFLTQRATLTARGRQFTLNGYLARSEQGGLRLIVTENFGNVLADLLVRPDGNAVVVRSSRAFRPGWIRNYMASDLKCLFGAAPDAGCEITVAAPDHLVIQRRWYRLDLRTVEVKPGPQPARLFEVVEPGKP